MAEHTLAENLIRLNQTKEDIADAIVAKGGTASHIDGLESMPAAIAAIPSTATVDQTYDPTSTNAQSGTAVAQAVAAIPSVTVDQTYDGTSANAQSGVAIEGKKPGLKTTGTEYTISGSTVVAAAGAEVFNDYTTNTASGKYSHAEGRGVIASGINSHAEGNVTNASGVSSHAEGYGTIASSLYQHVQGKWNVEDSSDTYAFIIGNGDFFGRHNAFAVDWNGLIYVNGATTGVDVAALAATIGDINSVLEEVL